MKFKLLLKKGFKSVCVLLICMLCNFNLQAQASGKITGLVSDVSGQPLPGANIIEKGTLNGTQTNFDGKFSLNVSNQNATLLISFIGFVSKEVTLKGGQTSYNIILNEDVASLDEIVLIGYGGVKKRDLTGAVASVSDTDLNRTINQSLVEGLDGRAAGVKILSGEGTPGGGISMRIRGGTSISASNEPLYVVDGFPVVVEDQSAGFDPLSPANTTSNPLAGIDPKDIESIEVLKDASATAIYGSRGANGVVIITTKKGRAGKSTITFETSTSFKTLSKKLDVLSPVQYLEYRLERESDPASDSAIEIQALLDNPENIIGTDWQDEVYQTAILQNHRLGMSGGSEDIQYNVSLGAFLDEGIIKTSGFDRYNGRVNLNGNLSDKLRFSAVLSGSHSEQTGAPTGGASAQRAGAVTQAVAYRPVDIPDEDSDITFETNSFNPINILNGTDIKNVTDLFLGNLSLEYDITDNLTFKTLVGVTTSNLRSSRYFSTNTGAGAFEGGLARVRQVSNRSWVNENILTYTNQFGDHSLTILGGATAQKNIVDNINIETSDFSVEDLGYNDLSIGASPLVGSLLELSTLTSGLARVNYSYRDKYLVTASIRADGSSRFADGKKWGYFPAASVAWKISEESFLENSELISNLKLRAGFGITGNQEVPRYRSLAALGTGFYSLGDDNGVVSPAIGIDRVSNPDLTWETTEQYNIGLDLGLIQDRVTATVDVYDKETTDMLLLVNLIPTAGIPTPALRNVGGVRNRGLELALRSVNVANDDFTWTTNFNISFNKNEVLDIGAFDQIFFDVQGGNQATMNEVILTPGESLGTFFGYETDGIAGTDGGPLGEAPGSRIFVDQLTVDTDGDDIPDAGDGVINSDDRVVLGNAQPKHYGGLTNTFNYKGFELDVFFNWSYGNKVYNANRVYFEEFHDGRNRTTAILDAWTPDNQDTEIAAIGSGDIDRLQDRHIEDASFIRLKSLTFSYNFNNSILDKTPFSSAKIYLSGQNLWTGTKYKGYNPEASVSPVPTTPGVDWGAYPLSRIYAFGLNVTF